MEYESPITYHSKDMANVKVFADRQTDGQAKNYMSTIFRYGGIKINCFSSCSQVIQSHITRHVGDPYKFIIRIRNVKFTVFWSSATQ
jgi:hypothetical protein